ncbi:hypothetical protein [Conexibacter sp. CPCC 206217]|uniref:hypothetical protein n=1 Tax=Conexibacter sp. CPCC 206217 TaxID=3064574 RepID=UPI0027260745|nr:hypothetical protein [Conexibacter sp. CPCC 206217]MDO8213534.1 hypothetical protein [Conexibacter sp. CPCC 206217]
MPAGHAFTDDFSLDEEPEQLLRRLLHASDHFGEMGYAIESHSPTGLVLVRRFVPAAVYRVPLGIAVAVFLLGALVDGTDPVAAGRIAGIMVLLAIVISIAVRATERVTITFTAADDGTDVLVSGQATPALRGYIESFAAVTAVTP